MQGIEWNEAKNIYQNYSVNSDSQQTHSQKPGFIYEPFNNKKRPILSNMGEGMMENWYKV